MQKIAHNIQKKNHNIQKKAHNMQNIAHNIQKKLTICRKSLAICRKSLTIYRKSFTICRKSLTICNVRTGVLKRMDRLHFYSNYAQKLMKVETPQCILIPTSVEWHGVSGYLIRRKHQRIRGLYYTFNTYRYLSLLNGTSYAYKQHYMRSFFLECYQ